MAVVHLVEERVGGDPVALKILHPHLASRPSARRRLERELEASERVKHPCVLAVDELIATDAGALALRMPVCMGGTLQERVDRDGPLGPTELQGLLDDLGGALDAAHAAGVLHRDLTPGNVLFTADGSLRLTDFGLARLGDGHTATATSALGTPGYAAPEAWDGHSRDPRSDAFSLGAVLYFGATGEPPYGGGTALAAIQRQLAGELVPLRAHRDDLEPALAHTIEGLLRPDLHTRLSVHDALRLLGAEDTPAEHGDDPSDAGPSDPPTRLQWTQVGSTLSMLGLIGVGWFQDLGPFLLSTIIDGHAIPKPDVFEMSQGVSALLLLPLCLMPALVGALAGWKRDSTKRLGPWVGIGVLAVIDLLYALAAGVVMPEMNMRSTADIFGTMLLHLGAFVPLSALVLLLSRPWQGLRAVARSGSATEAPSASTDEAVDTPSDSQALAEKCAETLDLLARAVADAPDPVRQDLSTHVAALHEELEAIATHAVTLQAGRDALGHDPTLIGRLEARLARARTLGGSDMAALEEMLAAHERTQAEVEALDAELIAITARQLAIQAAASDALRALLVGTTEVSHTRADLEELRRSSAMVRASSQEIS